MEALTVPHPPLLRQCHLLCLCYSLLLLLLLLLLHYFHKKRPS
jgi:hypothetical protein